MPIWAWELIGAVVTVVANGLVVAYAVGKKMQKLDDLVTDVGAHGQRLDKHEGKLVQLTVSGSRLATALATKHPADVFGEIAKSYDRIHGGGVNGA